MGNLPEDTFLTIAHPSEGLYKEKGSKFLAFAYPVSTEEHIKDYIHALKKKYYDARHHCYAYILGKDKERFRANDDGEPSSTAGKPILGQLYSYDVTNVMIVVVRYFGGKKLGASGLITAYKSAASDALENAKIVPHILTKDIKVTCSFAEVDFVMRLAKNYDLQIINQDYTATHVIIQLRVRENLLDEIRRQLDFAEKIQIKN
ncbi:putative YigZ family protein [Balneicella halophila]|uniref:Putative YigZ family protein n=1 Tax=Balneicella halophila TaxID=1537566 RepID=A0A7L4UPA8_BALHA|nr:YigZ family protein [Balneicella halophila]PVX50965.1 putative YigZ family protein [Balneicella halophila]